MGGGSLPLLALGQTPIFYFPREITQEVIMNIPLTVADIPVTQELVQYLFNYNAETGILSWKNPPNNRIKKGPIFSKSISGYYNVNIYRKKYQLHRIVWLYVHGYFPENGLDHIDRNKLNNKITNLREVSVQCNARNVGLRVQNISNVTGVSFEVDRIKWRATIKVNNKNCYLGRYSDYIEAVATRLAAEQCLGWHTCITDSPAYQCMQKWLHSTLDVNAVTGY